MKLKELLWCISSTTVVQIFVEDVDSDDIVAPIVIPQHAAKMSEVNRILPRNYFDNEVLSIFIARNPDNASQMVLEIHVAKDSNENESPKPTEKQLNFIKSICDELGLNDPEPKTKEEARWFISEHCDEFHKRVKWEYQSDWAIANGYF